MFCNDSIFQRLHRRHIPQVWHILAKLFLAGQGTRYSTVGFQWRPLRYTFRYFIFLWAVFRVVSQEPFGEVARYHPPQVSFSFELMHNAVPVTKLNAFLATRQYFFTRPFHLVPAIASLSEVTRLTASLVERPDELYILIFVCVCVCGYVCVCVCVWGRERDRERV